MASYTTQQGVQMTVTGISGLSHDSRTRQNVKKRLSEILYLEQPPDDAVKLAYVGSTEPTPTSLLFVGDRSDSLHANSRASTVQEYIGTQSPIDAKSKNFVCTQIFAEADNEEIPLYYKHVLPSTINPASVKIFDKNSVEVTQDKYVVEAQLTYDEDVGIPEDPEVVEAYYVFNSLEGSFNKSTGEYEVYFIQYTDTTGGDSVTSTLLNNKPAYEQATTSDIWHVTLELKPWKRVYNLDPNLKLTFSESSKFAIRYLQERRLMAEGPLSVDNTSPWFVRVCDGAFINIIGAIGTTGEPINISCKYSIPEFHNQAFIPIEPYKMASRAKCLKVSDNLIIAPDSNIVTDGSFIDTGIDIVIELDGEVLYAITNNDDKINTSYKDINNNVVYDSDGDIITWSDELFVGADGLSGLIGLDTKIQDSWDIYGWYTYEETYYELSSLNMNPLFDTDAHKQTRAVYLVPESSANQNQGIQDVAIQWVKVTPSGVIEAVSQNGDGNNEDISEDVTLTDSDGYSVDGVVGMHYNWAAYTTVSTATTLSAGGTLRVASTSTFPRSGWLRVKDTTGYWRYVDFVDKTTYGLVLGTSIPTSAMVPSGNTVEMVNFVDERTTETSRDATEELEASGCYATSSKLPPSFSGYFLLADLAINPPHSSKKAVIIDVRENGGGLIESKYDEAKQINPQAQWYADYGSFDGQTHPGNASVVVKLPISLLESYTKDYLAEVVEDNIAFGIKPLIRYYGYQANIIAAAVQPQHPIFLFINTGNSACTIVWEKEGEEFTYDIWIATDPNGPWFKVNRTRVIDRTYTYTDYLNEDYNYYTIYGLDEARRYCVKVTITDKYDLWWYGYSGYDSINGGYGLTGDAPTPPFGNTVGFQMTIGA